MDLPIPKSDPSSFKDKIDLEELKVVCIPDSKDLDIINTKDYKSV